MNIIYGFQIIIFGLIIEKGFAGPIPISSNEGNILKYEIEPWDDNKYHFAYEIDNGNQREETGVLKKSSSQENDVLVVKGFYSYIGTDNIVYRVDYIADENGFHPTVSKSETVMQQIEPKSMIGVGLQTRILPPGLIASLTG